ncbi:MAG: polysaccharide pyruvyl transferase family protein [Bacteroidales bacterium]|jgi:colanic acid/amylovoran biosynthesis protein|nr:polysaccharide pyruvyl transferase family protein [Bacteroidales bacterium]
MKIQIDGTGTVNKGAELMLYAILQEIERKYPDAEVLYNSIGEKRSYIQTSLNFKIRPFVEKVLPVLNRIKIPGILYRLSIPCSLVTNKYPVKGLDVVLDAGGFQFSDQWKRSDFDLLLWERYYRKLKEQGTKIILLPQAFGPFETIYGKKMAKMISTYADIIFAREKISYKYLINTGVDKNKTKSYPDFTALVEGIFPKQYESLKGGVCIIPNKRMIDKGIISQKDYLSIICLMIGIIRNNGKTPFLLNHEGQQDTRLCEAINTQLKIPLAIVDQLTALEVKGVISQSYLVISSRFHGVASALNSGVPCLATSWSHKYEELFKDYHQSDCILDLIHPETMLKKVENFLSEKTHNDVSEKLKAIKPIILEKNEKMWNVVWDFCSLK